MLEQILLATWETMYMTLAAALIAVIFGLPIGTLLCITDKNHILPNKSIHQSLNVIVNAARSVPFIILMIAVIPLTRLITGTSIGTNAAVVPLTLAVIPFIAKLFQQSLAKVSFGVIEAAMVMGASKWQIVAKVMLAEAKPFLVNDTTVTVVNLIGYSAMAGAIGGGGLGSLAIHYGYQRFDVNVMIITVVILIALVQGMQFLGDFIARGLNHGKK